MTEQTKEMVQVRCPLNVKNKKTGEVRVCNKLLLEVYPGSKGEAFCWFCHQKFDFEIVKESSWN